MRYPDPMRSAALALAFAAACAGRPSTTVIVRVPSSAPLKATWVEAVHVADDQYGVSYASRDHATVLTAPFRLANGEVGRLALLLIEHRSAHYLSYVVRITPLVVAPRASADDIPDDLYARAHELGAAIRNTIDADQ